MITTRHAHGYIVQKCNVGEEAAKPDDNGRAHGSWTNVSNDYINYGRRVLESPFHATVEDAYKALDAMQRSNPSVRYRVVTVTKYGVVQRPIVQLPFKVGALYQSNRLQGAAHWTWLCAAVSNVGANTGTAVMVPQGVGESLTYRDMVFNAKRENWTEVPG